MTILGRDIHTKQLVELSNKARMRGIYCIGKNGTGKTTLVENMVVDSMERGAGLALLDPHGDVTENILRRIPDKRMGDVYLLDVMDTDFPFPLNLFSCSDPSDPKIAEATVEQVIQAFSKVFGMSAETPRLNQYVRNIAYAMIGTNYTMCEIPLLLQDSRFRASVLRNEKYTSFWKSYDRLRESEQLDRSESTLDRIDSLISNSIIRNIVGQTKTIDFLDIMNSGKILLIKLNRSYMDMTRLLGSIIIGQILMAALSRTSNRRSFHLYIDEFQHSATPAAQELLSEARKFGISTMVCHQYRSQLDLKNQGGTLNAGTLITFGIIGEDAEEMSREFDATPPPAIIPKGTLPRMLLPRLEHHQHHEVKEFYGRYILPMEQAMKKQARERHGTDLYGDDVTQITLPVHDFGEGQLRYDPADVEKMYNQINDFLYESLAYPNKELVKAEELLVHQMIWNMGKFLYFEAYGEITYCEKAGIPPQLDLPRDNARAHAILSLSDDGELDRQKQRYQRFVHKLKRVLGITLTLEGKIEVSSTEWKQPASQQTYSDRQKQIANYLVSLPVGRAKVKMSSGEYTIDTILPTGGKGSGTEKRTQVVEQTRATYCTSRQVVEAEIRARQRIDDEPMTKRRG